MLFNDMYQTAMNVAAQEAAKNTPLGTNDTICVVCTASGRVYYGISKTSMTYNGPVSVHAEIDVCNNLMNAGDTVIAEIGLFNAVSYQPMLPCSACASQLTGLNPANANAVVLLPDSTMPLGGLAQGAGFGGQPNAVQMNNSPINAEPMNVAASASEYAMPKEEESSYMKDRLSSLFADDIDDEDEDEKKPEKAPKKLFGLFGGRKDK